MFASCFKTFIDVNPIQLLRDIMLLVRDVLAVTNDFLHLQMVSQLINFINLSIGEPQKDKIANIN